MSFLAAIRRRTARRRGPTNHAERPERPFATTHTMAAVQLADARPEETSSDEDEEVESDSESGDDEQKDFYYEDKYKEDDNYLGEDVFRVEAIRSTQRARTASPPLSTPIYRPR